MAKMPAVGPGQQPEVHGQLVGQQVPAARRLDRVDVADEIGDGDIGRCQLFDVALVAPEPGDRRGVAALGQQLPGVLRDRRERVVVHLAPGDDRDPLIEQTGQLAEDSALGLAPEAQQDEVMPGEQGVHDLGEDGVFVAHDSRERAVARLQPGEQVAPDLVANGPPPERRLGPAAVLQSPNVRGSHGTLMIGI